MLETGSHDGGPRPLHESTDELVATGQFRRSSRHSKMKIVSRPESSTRVD